MFSKISFGIWSNTPIGNNITSAIPLFFLGLKEFILLSDDWINSSDCLNLKVWWLSPPHVTSLGNGRSETFFH